MGQIQSSVNELATSMIRGAVANSLAGDSIKNNLGFKKTILGMDPERIDAANEAVGNMIGADIKSQEDWEKINKMAEEQDYNRRMFNTVAAKYGTNAAKKMEDAELQYKFREITDPQGLAKEEEENAAVMQESLLEEAGELVNAGWDEDRAMDFVTTGADTMDNPEAAIPNYKYDSTKGQQANNVSLKQSMTKKRLNKGFENRLANAKSRKIRQQSVGGKK